jgi:TolB protein
MSRYVCFFALLSIVPVIARSQDSVMQVKPAYTIVNPKISVIEIPTHTGDNANIDLKAQFKGMQLIPKKSMLAQEKHLTNIRQLTFAGENAEAYLDPANETITFQARGDDPSSCDQIFVMSKDGLSLSRASSGKGRTTCSYFMPTGHRVLYSSTHEYDGGSCLPAPDRSKGYVWPLYSAFDIYVYDYETKKVSTLVKSPGYDAEATVSPKGDRIVFTSTRDGDIELYSMNPDGTDVKRLTNEEGYDGGAFYSPDGSQIVFRASRPKGDALAEYRELLKQDLVKPNALEIYIMDADGSNKRQLTNNGAANFAPCFYADGKRILFSSNMADPNGRNFDLYSITTEGKDLERVTFHDSFDGFPFFSSDGKQLVFCSNRGGSTPNNTNIFIADWVE